MKIVFMGTPDFAIPSIKVLLENKHEIVTIVTTPDKERGRGQKVTFTPVKEFAIENNIPLLQPVSMKDEEFIEKLKSLGAELFIIVAFRILPKEVYTVPPKGSFNLHGSLLPKYRGAAPIQWALINGDKETGVTTFFLQDKVDTGNIIISEKLPIDDEDNFGTLHDKMSQLGASVVLRTVQLIEKGDVPVQKQTDSSATPAPKITKETARINWNRSALEIHNLIRGLSPYPAAYFTHNNKIIKVYKSQLSDKKLKPGEIFQTKTDAIVGTAEGSLCLLEVQLEGRKRLSIEEFLRGYSFTQA
ncbi:MAG: methionyl-tRNA formyltransferase [Bacteroidota bacterium]|nr:methionyl-tRNA formyltransferase [Bacteroidota bacterium]MDP4196325.1 methionyl-tRNA formyltransferase [Bacteroidota bacterium]